MPSSVSAWAVIVAAGQGERFGSHEPKQFAPVAGRPLVLWAVQAFREHPDIKGVTLVVPPTYKERPPDWLKRLEGEGVATVAGGAGRSDSVRLGLETVPREVELVAVHDGARPLITRSVISQVLRGVAPGEGAVAARRVTDSLKRLDTTGRVVGAVVRDDLWRAETPQVFPRDLIIDVHRRARADGAEASDCAGLCERYGVKVVLVEIAEPNPKVTRPQDLEIVEALILSRAEARKSAELAPE